MKLTKWLKSMEYLPEVLRDFHDQKNIFKSMHFLYQDNESADTTPNWRDGHIYVIDWFLWFMASRGYTLQRSRKKVAFRDMPDFRKLMEREGSGAENTRVDGWISVADVIEIYNAGYVSGHHDTVEACYTDVHYSDRREYHNDTVGEMLDDMELTPPEA